MNCETARATIVDDLADTIDGDTRAALDRHLAECATCRAEAAQLRSLWNELGDLEVPSPGKTVLNAATFTPARVTARPRFTLIAASVALLVGIGSGWFARAAVGMPGDTVVPPLASEPQEGRVPYLLLLHGPPSPPAGTPPPAESAVAAAVARYTAWADTLRMRGQLLVAEKLETEGGHWLGTLPAAGPIESDIGGFFVIRARSYDEAESIASGSPHIGYGGTIELRAIENTGGL
jgi:hypothetical protein